MLKQFKDRVKKSAADRLTYRAIMTTIPASATVEEIAKAIILISDYRKLVSFETHMSMIDKIRHPILTRRIGHLDFWTTCATRAFNS